MNTRIPKEKIICFNVIYVYFLEGGKVYRGKRKGHRNVKILSARESNVALPVHKNSIEEVKHFWGRSNQSLSAQKTAKVLQRYGVEIV